VTNSESIIPMLPWGKDMEKEKFLAPDFTSIEVVNVASNSVALGQNIPNYDDIRENEGFKNVYFGNVMPKAQGSTVQFATPEQVKTLVDYTLRSYQVHVACHELLGHGTGKLIYRAEDGSCPTFTDPITGDKFESCYEKDDTWSSRFGACSSAYEECRADTVGYFLCTLKEVYSLFGIEDHEVEDMLWTNVMNQLRKGTLGLTLYNPETKKWGQAHTQGAWVITMWLYKNQQSKIVDFEILDNDIRIHLDKANLVSEGKELIRKLLIVLQTYKSSGCVERGAKWFNEYSVVDDMFIKVRDIVMANKKPRVLKLSHNLVRYNENTIAPVTYPENFAGIIHAYQDRWPYSKALSAQILAVWDESKTDLRVV